MPELTPEQHQAKRTARIKAQQQGPLGSPNPATDFGQVGIGQGPGGPGRAGMPPPMPPRMPPMNPGIGQGLPPGLGQLPRMPPVGGPGQPWNPAPGARPLTYDLATTIEGAKTGGLPQFKPQPFGLDIGMRKNQLQSQALAPQFG